MSTENAFDDMGDDIQLVNEKALNWFDVSAIGTGEMLFTAGWAWIIYIAAEYGTKWLLIGFAGGAVVMHCAWWLYREMVTAVPEPGSLQSYAREAGIFSIGTTYFVGYAPLYGVFMWLELIAAKGLLSLLFPAVPDWIWPIAVIVPVLLLNLMGHQITGKVQAALVVLTLVGDVILAVGVWWLLSDSTVWTLNWDVPAALEWDWSTPFTIVGLWVALMAGMMEVQQVMVDEWDDFEKSRDIGLLSAAWQLWGRQIPLSLGLLATLPAAALVEMPVPTVEAIQQILGEHPIFYLAVVSMLIATYTTLSVYFMAMGKVVALYAQQGALPRAMGQYSSRSVPWIAILFLAGFALIGGYFTTPTFIEDMLSEWSATLYFVVAWMFIGMRRRKDLDRPLVAKWGLPVAYFLLVYTAIIALAVFVNHWQAGIVWYAVCAAFIAYDHYIVPNTKRGGFYRAQVLRRRTSAAQL